MASELSAQSYEQMENPLQYFEDVTNGSNPMTRATPAYAPYTSTAGYRDVGGSAPYMDPALLKRPARKQVSNRSYYEDHPSDGQDYNIWYHKRPGFRQDKFEERENPGTRCSVLTDAGKTKANKKSPFCVYFALGRCAMGSDCQYQHRIPTFDDEDRHDLAHDIFGRERHATDKDDMSGVGNFTRECRTLYVGCVKMSGNIEEAIKRHFEEWGPIEYSRAIHTKSIAFVRYYLRASAEFAKEAMQNQSLDNNDVLMIRWATDDTNPIAKEYEEKRKHVIAADALNKRLKIMGAADQSTMYYQITGQYPNTNEQYPEMPGQQGQESYSYEFAGYSTTHTNEQHPYASLAAARKAALEQHLANVAAAGGQVDLSATALPSYDGFDYASYYYQYGYPAEGYGQAAGAGPEQVYSEFMPAYRTAETALAEQEDEDEGEEENNATGTASTASTASTLAPPPGFTQGPGAGAAQGGKEKEKEKEGSKAEGEEDLQSFYAAMASGASASSNNTEDKGKESAKVKESSSGNKESSNKGSGNKESGNKSGKSSGSNPKSGAATTNTSTKASKPTSGGQIKKDSTVKKSKK